MWGYGGSGCREEEEEKKVSTREMNESEVEKRSTGEKDSGCKTRDGAIV